jgi:hypothetical protein
MTQIISSRWDRVLRRSLLLAPPLLLAAGGLAFWHVRSEAYARIGESVAQPIGFRHDLHVRGVGLDCTFCHAGAPSGASAGMPAAETCLVCHRRLWRGTQALQPLYTSVELRQPIAWNSLYALPEHARFHHGAHAAASVGCATCHGEVERMTKTIRAQPMSMSWCL